MSFRGLSKKDFSIIIGNVIDHFDSSLYGFLAPIMGPIFFPNYDPIISIITAYSIYATSIITRPLGSIIFGILAHRYGANNSLFYALIGVSISSIFIGIIPSYESIEIMAPILLIFIRAVREIFSAGEMSIAKLYILENKTEKEAFKASYIYQTSSMFGIVCASIASTIVIFLDSSNAWRICFIFGGALAVVGIIIRSIEKNIEETKNSKIINNTLANSYNERIIDILLQHKTEIIKVVLVSGLSYLTYSIPFIIMNNIIPLISPQISLNDMMASNSALLIFDMLILPIIGIKLVSYHPRKILLFSSLIILLSLPFVWYFLLNNSLFYINLVRIWIIILGCIIACSLNLWCHRLVHTKSKYIIIGIGHSLGSSVIGKMSPAICIAILHYSENYMMIILYISLIVISAIFSLLK